MAGVEFLRRHKKQWVLSDLKTHIGPVPDGEFF